MLKRKVGIEIEFLAPNVDYEWTPNGIWTTVGNKTVKKLQKASGVDIQLENPKKRTWSLKDDCSVEDCTNWDRPGYELVTPPMTTKKEFDQLRSMLDCLKKNKYGVNDTCGLHVHVDAKGLTPYQIVAVASRYNALIEDIECLFSEDRLDNEHCTPNHDVAELAMAAILAKSKSQFKRRLDACRYSSVNIRAIACHGTIEFRQHHGTLDYDRIEAWAKFCVNFVEQTLKELKGHRIDKRWVRPVLNYNKRYHPNRVFESYVIPSVYRKHEDQLFPQWKGSALKGLRGKARWELTHVA